MMKLEEKIEYGYYPSPKLYGFITVDGREVIKCKGLNYNDVTISKLRGLLNRKKSIESHYTCVSKIRSILNPNINLRKGVTECYDLCRFAKRNENKRVERKNFMMYPICL